MTAKLKAQKERAELDARFNILRSHIVNSYEPHEADEILMREELNYSLAINTRQHGMSGARIF